MAKTFTEKNYISGSAKLVTFPDGGELVNVDLRLSDLLALTPTPGGYIKITMARKTAPDKYDNSYAIYENKFKPKPQGDRPSKPSVTGPDKDSPFD